MPECPECKDIGKHATDPYRPYCRIAHNEVMRHKFEAFCKSYSNYRNCDTYKKKYDR